MKNENFRAWNITSVLSGFVWIKAIEIIFWVDKSFLVIIIWQWVQLTFPRWTIRAVVAYVVSRIENCQKSVEFNMKFIAQRETTPDIRNKQLLFPLLLWWFKLICEGYKSINVLSLPAHAFLSSLNEQTLHICEVSSKNI